MSSLIVKIHKLKDIKPHSNADKLEIVVIDGWQCVVGKGTFKVNDLVVYVPPDCVLPDTLAESWGVKNYLSTGNRVKSVKLRGEYSHGIVIKSPFITMTAGDDVAETLGITKWIPPVISNNKGYSKSSGQAPNHPSWVRYDGPEHLRNYPDAISDTDEVVVLEKIHGSLCHICMFDGEIVVSSKNHNRYYPSKVIRRNVTRIERWVRKILNRPYEGKRVPAPENLSTDWYWYPTTIPGVISLLNELSKKYTNIQIFGEVFGPVQHLNYGSPDKLQFRVFDIMVNGQYIDHGLMLAYCGTHDVPVVPELYRGPYNFAHVKSLANGTTQVGSNKNQISEGVVVKTVVSKYSPKIGRLIFKMVSDDYLVGKTELNDFEEM